jgi:hypothetical protein
LKLEQVAAVRDPDGKGHLVRGEVHRDGRLPRTEVEVTVETAKGEVTKPVTLEGAVSRFSITTDDPPRRVVVDKYGATARANGGVFSVGSFRRELDQTLIVYGTADELPSNREAAEALQRAIVESGPNITVPVKADREVTDEDLKSHHLILIGRPDSNAVVERCRAALPVTFGSRSFTVDREAFAHPGSAVLAAGENPANKRYSVVIVAGLGAASTLQAAPALAGRAQRSAEVVVLANGGRPRAVVLPAKELVSEVKE